MKPFLAIDLTSDKKNDKINGSEFLVQTPSAGLSESFDNYSEKVENTEKEANLPLFFNIVKWVCAFAAIIFARGVFGADASFSEGYKNAPWAYWIFGISLIAWFVLWVWGKCKSKKVFESDDSMQTISHLECAAYTIYKDLDVPDEAKSIDLLSFFYKIKDGNIKVHQKGLQIPQYFNPEFKIFTDDENLYLANLEGKYAFPWSSIEKVHTVNKHISIDGWHKAEHFQKGIYKQFKLQSDQYGCVHGKNYYIIEIKHPEENFGIYIPNYELPILREYLKHIEISD